MERLEVVSFNNLNSVESSYVTSHKRADFQDKVEEVSNYKNHGQFGYLNHSSLAQKKEIDAKFSIFVGSLTDKVQQEDLIMLFSQFGIRRKVTNILKLSNFFFLFFFFPRTSKICRYEKK